MKAVILSAGQGRRLLPLTAELPKCALPIGDRALILWQLEELASAGIDEVVVVLGYGAERVERLLRGRPCGCRVRTLYNAFYGVSDNLATCWLARPEMDGDFVLLNGDTLFEPAVVRRLLTAPPRPVTVALDRKAAYDDDDMKVHLDGDRLVRVGKDLPAGMTDGEAIGMVLFRGDGPQRFRRALDRAIRRPQGLRQWYVSAIDDLARSRCVGARLIEGLAWTEVDTRADLLRARQLAGRWSGMAPSATP